MPEEFKVVESECLHDEAYTLYATNPDRFDQFECHKCKTRYRWVRTELRRVGAKEVGS